MATFNALPGTLALKCVRGDTLSVDVDFDVNVTGYTHAAEVTSIVTGETLATMTATVTGAGAGLVTYSLTDAQTAGLVAGTYAWNASWLTGAGDVRTVLSGFLEVVAH